MFGAIARAIFDAHSRRKTGEPMKLYFSPPVCHLQPSAKLPEHRTDHKYRLVGVFTSYKLPWRLDASLLNVCRLWVWQSHAMVLLPIHCCHPLSPCVTRWRQMFEEIRQKLGAVLQQSFLETNPRYFLNLATLMLETSSFDLGICNWIMKHIGQHNWWAADA